MNAPAHPEAVVTLEDLRHVERSMFQDPASRFTTEQRLFFEALLSDPNMDYRKAAKTCGIAPSKAQGWLTQNDCQTALNHLLRQRMKRLNLDKDALLLKIADCLEMAVGEAPIKKVAYNHAEQEFISQQVYETDLSAAARFTDQLGKHFRLFGEAGSATQVIINMDMLTPNAANASSTLNAPNAAAAVTIEQDLLTDASQRPQQALQAVEDDLSWLD